MRTRKTHKKLWYDELIIKYPHPTYKQLLNTYDWSVRRFEILRRDNFKCSKCDHTNSAYYLHVHHVKYISGTLPWKYEDEQLITLCDECHAELHGHKNPNAAMRKGIAEYIKNGCKF